jgi:hypothetical protein
VGRRGEERIAAESEQIDRRVRRDRRFLDQELFAQRPPRLRGDSESFLRGGFMCRVAIGRVALVPKGFASGCGGIASVT